MPHSNRVDFRIAHESDQTWLKTLYFNAEVMAYISGGAMSLEDATAHAARATSGSYPNGQGYYVIQLKDQPINIGYAVLRPFLWDERFVGTELGYLLDRPFWGKGYATSAAAAMVKFATETLNEEKLLAMISLKNQASMHVVQKLGFQKCPQTPLHHPENAIWDYIPSKKIESR